VSAQLGRAVALGEYPLTLDELSQVVSVASAAVRGTDDCSQLIDRLWHDLITIDIDLAREAFTTARDNQLIDTSWIVRVAQLMERIHPTIKETL
jgi:hypothetical protein